MRVSILVLTMLGLAACDTRPDTELTPAKPKTLAELQAEASPKATKEELLEARRKAGFRSNEERMAEAAAKYEREGRIYVKERIADYRKLLGDIGAQFDELEASAKKWSGKKGQATFDRFMDGYKKATSELSKRHKELTSNGTEGANTEAALGELFRAWEDLGADLSAEFASQDAFKSTMAELRAKLDALSKTLDEIEADATLVRGEPPPADAAAAGEAKAGDAKAGDAKADDAKADGGARHD